MALFGFDLATRKASVLVRASDLQSHDRPMSRDQRIELQEILVALGYDTGGIEGVLGTRTREAIRAFQRAKGLPMDGHPSLALLDRMRSERRL